MNGKRILIRFCIMAALAVQGAAVCAAMQKRRGGKTPAPATKPQEHNTETSTTPAAVPTPPPPKKTNPERADQSGQDGAGESGAAKPAPEEKKAEENKRVSDERAARYFYEFRQPDFVIRHIQIEHDKQGRGTVTFERISDSEPLIEPLELSSAALERINARWTALRFLDSDANYQSEKQRPSLGTTRLRMREGGRERTVEFNFSDDRDAYELANEYRRAAEQVLFVFEMKLALENQPLEAPKLLTRLERLLNMNALSDPQQLLPLLRELHTDERIPLIARNQITRLLKKLDK